MCGVFDGERAATYGYSDGGRRRRGSAGEQAVQSAQDRMEYDTHGGRDNATTLQIKFDNSGGFERGRVRGDVVIMREK